MAGLKQQEKRPRKNAKEMDQNKLLLIFEQAHALYDGLSKIEEDTISDTSIEICDRLVDELSQINVEDKSFNLGRACSWLGSGGKTRYARRSDVISKLSQIEAVASVAIGAAKAPGARKRANVFISHGKKTEHLELTRRFIEALGLNALIVKEKASKGKSVNQTVEAYMSNSDCVILLATADVEAKDGFHANENVINEEGMAKKYVGEKIIYLLEDAVEKIPSNFAEKIYGRFNPDNMTEAFIKIAKELTAFGLV